MTRAALTRRLLLALGLTEATVACSAPAREPSPPPPAGSVSAVASSAPVTTTATAPAAPPESVVALPVENCAPRATSTARSPLHPPPLPGPPPNDHRPTVEVHDVCRHPGATTPPRHYPAPYERCPVNPHEEGEMDFSTCLTDANRRTKADVCCYHETIVHNAGRPLRIADASVRAPLTGRAWG